MFDVNNKEDKYEIVLGMKELASKGMAAEAVEEVNALDPDFFLQNPILLFQLKQVSGSCIVSGFLRNIENWHLKKIMFVTVSPFSVNVRLNFLSLSALMITLPLYGLHAPI